MLIDSNVIIYAAQTHHIDLRQFIDEITPSVSVVAVTLVIGYHKLGEDERQYMEQFFQKTEILPLSDTVMHRAVGLRQQRRMSLGDAIIAATAIVHDRILVTHNVQDFLWISELNVLDPLTEGT